VLARIEILPIAEMVFIVMVFLMTGALIAAIFSKVPIPYTVILVLIGALLQWLAELLPALEPLQHFILTPEIILFIFLPALIFEAGLGIHARQLAKDIAPILILAVPALLISTFIIGYGVSLIAGLPFTVALVFGALISATDPVAVISLFKELGAPRRLTILVEGESLFNDATAIVLFNLLLGLLLFGGFSASDTPRIILDFCIVFLGGALLGFIFGAVVSALVSRIKITGSGMLVITLTLAYMAFIVAEHDFHVSGVMAVTFSALIFSLIVVPRLPETELHSLHNTWEFLANICNTLLFILVGYSINLANVTSIIGILLLTVLLVILARASVIYSLVPITVRLLRLPTITWAEQHIMWWGGLKGGLAIAMVLSIPESVEQRQLLVDLTAGVVLFTLLVNAPSIRIIIRKLGIDRLTDFEDQELKACLHHVDGSIGVRLEELVSAEMISPTQSNDIRDSVKQGLSTLDSGISQRSKNHYGELKSISWEIKELEKLFRGGIVTRITYLDILDEKLNRLDSVTRDESGFQNPEQFIKQRTLKRFDSFLVKTFREKDWAVPLMSRYFIIRLEENLKNIVANLLVYRSVLNNVESHDEIEPTQRDRLISYYQLMLGLYRGMLLDMKKEFPHVFSALEEKFAMRAALESASKQAESGFHSGNLSIRPYKLLEARVKELIEALSKYKKPAFDDTHKEHLANVSLFNDVPEVVLDEMLAKAATMAFIAGDVIVGEGDSGNALYVILDGEVLIKDIDKDPDVILATLTTGDFFGEMALLGEFTRTANVEAKSSCVLLRITHKTITTAAKKHPGLYAALDAARKQRMDDNLEKFQR